MTILIPGGDVSAYQDINSTPQKIDFEKMAAAGFKFVFIRVANGTTPDEDFADNWKAAKKAGILRGGYCFYNYPPGWDQKASAQVAKWYELLAPDPGEIPPAIDFERPRADWPELPSQNVCIDTIWQFDNMVRTRLNRDQSGIYTNPAAIHARLKNPSGLIASPFLLSMYLWLAHWYVTNLDFEPWIRWSFWQQGLGKGKGPTYGVESLDIDTDYYNGSLDDLKREFHIAMEDQKPLTLEERVAALEAQAKSHGWQI